MDKTMHIAKKVVCALLTVAAACSAGAQTAHFSNPPSIAKPFGYSHVAVVPGGQKMIFVAGQLGFLPDGKMAGEAGDFKAQAQQAFKNVDAALKAAGAKWENVVKINMYVTDVKSQMPLLRQVRDGFVNTSAPPTSTTVEIPRLVIDGALFEIDAVAVLP